MGAAKASEKNPTCSGCATLTATATEPARLIRDELVSRSGTLTLTENGKGNEIGSDCGCCCVAWQWYVVAGRESATCSDFGSDSDSGCDSDSCPPSCSDCDGDEEKGNGIESDCGCHSDSDCDSGSIPSKTSTTIRSTSSWMILRTRTRRCRAGGTDRVPRLVSPLRVWLASSLRWLRGWRRQFLPCLQHCRVC